MKELASSYGLLHPLRFEVKLILMNFLNNYYLFIILLWNILFYNNFEMKTNLYFEVVFWSSNSDN
jgi:hypothetical protein